MILRSLLQVMMVILLQRISINWYLNWDSTNIFLVAHDVGAQTAYSYAVDHPSNVTKMVIMDFIFPGFIPPEFGNGSWWFGFHQTRDIPEMLTEGKSVNIFLGFIKD